MELLPKTHDLILYSSRVYSFIDVATEERHFTSKDRDNRRRACRYALSSLCAQGLLRRMQQPRSRINPNPAPFYIATESGCARLATERGDMSLLLDRPIVIRNYNDVPHSLEVAQFLIEFHEPLLRQSVVQVLSIFTEHHVINPDAPASERCGLLTEVGTGTRGGRMVCAPDACLIVRRGDHIRAYCVELETGSDDPRRCAKKKAPGYYQLHHQGLVKKLGSFVQDFRVLVSCPTESWRDEFRKAMEKLPGGELWLAVTRKDVDRSGRFLTSPVFWPVGRTVPLAFAPPAPSPALVQADGKTGGRVILDGST